MKTLVRRYLVTGANTGIGKATALGLAQPGVTLLLAGRSALKTEPVVRAAQTQGAEAVFFPVELGDLTSVRDLARTLLLRAEPIDAVIANAGLASIRGQTAQGFELAFGVNHLAHFGLVLSILPLLGQGRRSRVVVVSSDSHYHARGISWDRLTRPTRTFLGLYEYEVSKLCNVLFARELARRLDPAQSIDTYALHPGTVATDIWRRLPEPFRSWIKRPMLSVEEGARTTLFCTLDPNLTNVTGRYFADAREKEPSRLAKDAALAAELFERSVAWCEPIFGGLLAADIVGRGAPPTFER